MMAFRLISQHTTHQTTAISTTECENRNICNSRNLQMTVIFWSHLVYCLLRFLACFQEIISCTFIYMNLKKILEFKKRHAYNKYIFFILFLLFGK